LYMGDEIGLRNDESYLDELDTASDSRWIHRPRMDWIAAARRRDQSTVEGRLFTGLQTLIAARVRTPQLSATAPLMILDDLDDRAFGFVREHPLGPLVALHDFADVTVRVDPKLLPRPVSGAFVDVLDESRWDAARPIVIPARGTRWLVDRASR
jgi:amylosucrase